MSSDRKIWFVTGVARGFGREITRQVLQRGDVVVGTSRDGQLTVNPGPGEFHCVPLEVTNASQVRASVEHALGLHGRIDVLINNAGYGLFGAIEEVSEEQARHLFDVNFFGAWNVIRAVLPSMRARRSGHIVNLSSIAGLVAAPGTGLYAASKFALEGMSQSLAQELAPLGIHVTLVEPGSFRTEFLSTSSLQIAADSIDDYTASAHVNIERLKNAAGRQPGDPVKAVGAIIDAVYSPEPPLQLLLGPDALRRVEERLQQFSAVIERNREVTLSTDLQA